MNFFTACALGFAALGAPAFAADGVDLLLVAPDDATLQPLLDELGDARRETHAAWTFWLGDLAGHRVALTHTDRDPLNAVAATTLALRRHPPRLVFVFGPARAHDPALQRGDVVVATAFAAFDGMVSPVAALGEKSRPLQWRKLPHLLMTAGEKETPRESFPADVTAAQRALALDWPHGRVTAGMLGSAPQINREADRIAYLRSQWQTSSEDGESAHVAGCATLFGVPVAGARVIDGTPAEAAAFARRFVEAWR